MKIKFLTIVTLLLSVAQASPSLNQLVSSQNESIVASELPWAITPISALKHGIYTSGGLCSYQVVIDAGNKVMILEDVNPPTGNRTCKGAGTLEFVEYASETVAEGYFGANRLIEGQRIDDAIAREGVDVDTPLVDERHVLTLRIQIEDALVVIERAFQEGNFHLQARLGDHALGITKTQDKSLLSLLNRKERSGQQKENDDADNGANCDTGVHYGALAGACDRFWISGSGR